MQHHAWIFYNRDNDYLVTAFAFARVSHFLAQIALYTKPEVALCRSGGETLSQRLRFRVKNVPIAQFEARIAPSHHQNLL